MSLLGDEPVISAKVEPGPYAAYFAAQNVGVDEHSLGEISEENDEPLSDEELAARKDLEWYRVYLVPGRPARRGRLVDRDTPLPIKSGMT